MPQKRSRNPPLRAFGQRLLELRGKRSRQQIANRLVEFGAPLDASSLFQYEAGTVWAPDAGVLWGLSKIYGVSLDELVTLLRENRKRTDAAPAEWNDLIRHGRTGQQTPHLKGGADVPTEARVRELEDRLAQYERLAPEIQAVLVRLTNIAAGEEISATRKPATKGSGSRRKIG